MSISIKYLPILCVTLFSTLFSFSHAEEPKQPKEVARLLELLPDCVSPPVVTFAIPDEFHVFSSLEDIEAHLATGILWTTEDVAKDYWKASLDRNSPATITNGAFLVVFSMDVAQSGPKSFSDKNGVVTDKKLEAALKKMGIENAKIRRSMWGTYPLISITGYSPATNQPVAMAWIGMNSSTFVLRISYAFSADPAKHERDLQIWKKFIEKTAPIPKEKLSGTAKA